MVKPQQTQTNMEQTNENLQFAVISGENEFILTIRPPGFEELSAGYNALLSGMAAGRAGIPNLPKAGKVLIDTLLIEGETNKMFFDKVQGPKLMFSAALEVAKLVEAFDAEIKKK